MMAAKTRELARRLEQARLRATPRSQRSTPSTNNTARVHTLIGAAQPRVIASSLSKRILDINETDRNYHDLEWYDTRRKRIAHLQVRYETHMRTKFLVIKQIELSAPFRKRGIWNLLSNELLAKGVPVMIQSIVNVDWFRALYKSGRWIPIGQDFKAIDNSTPRSRDEDYALISTRVDKVIDLFSYNRMMK